MKKFTIGLVLLAVLLMPVSASAEALIPGGQIIGIKLGDPMTVAAFDPTSAAREAGIQIGDRITHINNIKVESAQSIKQVLSGATGPVSVRYERNGAENTLSVTPRDHQLGIYLKQCVTGIGTVTYYDPESGSFGALGHGVNNKNGDLLPMNTGNIYDASVISVAQGTSGEPGKLMGALHADQKLGALRKNTPQGIFGSVNASPNTQLLETGTAHVGDAVIRSTVSGDGLQEYSVKILKVYPQSRADGRNMLLQITDPALLSTTGGIVQGMSGSPIIQSGKIVGAVTHVLVNDPTTGYGIFIENMLDAAS